MKNKVFVLDYEIVDAIALQSMKDHLKYVKKEVKACLKKGEYLHPEDLAHNQLVLIPAFEALIKYYGG